MIPIDSYIRTAVSQTSASFCRPSVIIFSHFPGKHVTLIIYSSPQRGDTTTLGPQGPSNLRTLRPEGRSILRTFFQIKNSCETIDFTGIFYFSFIIYVRKYPRAVHRLRFHLPNLSPWPPVWKHPHHGPGRTVSRCQCGGQRDPCYSRHCR